MKLQIPNGSYFNYFRRPFPRAEGFSAYRMPGMAVQIPILLIFAIIGSWVVSPVPALFCVMPIFLIIGIYAGRDLAILAHYNPLIIVAVYLALPLVLSSRSSWPEAEMMTSIAATIVVVALFGLHLRRWVKMVAEDEVTSP